MSSGTTDSESGARGLRSVLASPWARRTWRDLGFTVLSAGLNLLPLFVMALPWTWTFYVPVSLPAVLTCVFVSVAAAVALCPWLTVPRRACFYEVLGVRIPRPPTLGRWLCELVRGLHPVVLEDRGLDAALTGIAARSPVPVRLSVDVPRRVSPTVEAVGYFIVSEALANVNKHARATAVQVDVRLDGLMLRISITDDGIGGADAGRGTGLTGLAQRAASVDGRFAISSPLGGPTTIKVDLPCEL
jgi:hypothetical protein